MSVTTDQLLEAMKAAQRMKTALDAHLTVLDRKAERMSREGRAIPSSNAFFLYVSDQNGVIKLQQDAAFLVESVLVVDPVLAPGTTTPLFYEIALKDANSGRDLTTGSPAPTLTGGGSNSGTGTDKYAGALSSEPTPFVPGMTFVPVNGYPGDQVFAPNVDDWKTVKTEYILPRGGVVRVVFKSVGATSVGKDGVPYPTVILSGYKVF